MQERARKMSRVFRHLFRNDYKRVDLNTWLRFCRNHARGGPHIVCITTTEYGVEARRGSSPPKHKVAEGWGLDRVAPDRFDLAGALICLGGVGVIMYWPPRRLLSRRLADLEDLRPHGLLDARVTHAEEARAIGRGGAHAGLETAADLVERQRVVEDLQSLRREYVDRLVLPDRHFAAVVAQGRNPTEKEERQIGRPGRNDEPLDFDLLAVVRTDRLGHAEIRPDRIHQQGEGQSWDLVAVRDETEKPERGAEAHGEKRARSLPCMP